MRRRLAAADIGSNTVHLLIAETDGRTLQRMINQTEWLSLGEAVARSGSIPERKAEVLIRVLREYKNSADSARAEKLFVFATEAMRAATNGHEVLDRIWKEVGIRVQIVTPRQEAELSFRGASLDAPSPTPSMMFEVGGGSAQVASCKDGLIVEEISLPLGTGKLTATANLTQPATPLQIESAKRFIEPIVESIPIIGNGRSALASGGVVRGLWRALHPDGEKRLALQEIDYLAWASSHLSVEQIIQRFRVKPKRAAALLPGAMVYAALMRKFGIEELFVSEFGVREGAILEMAEGRSSAWPA